MLHNKLSYDVLYGKIVDKNEINKANLYNNIFLSKRIFR